MTQIKYSNAKLARDDNGSILQVGSYDTENFTTLATTEMMSFDSNSVVRVQAYNGDCWLSRFTLENASHSIFDLYINGVNSEVLTKTDEFIWTEGTAWFVVVISGKWDLSFEGSSIATAKYIAGDLNPPLYGWKSTTDIQYNLSPDGVYTGKAPADATGLLLPEGSELTMGLDKYDVIGSVGGSLNITEISK